MMSRDTNENFQNNKNLIEEVLRILVQHHTTDLLEWEDILGPGLCHVQWVKVELVEKQY